MAQTPIKAEHELICPGCGVVLKDLEEVHTLNHNESYISPAMFSLGSAIARSSKNNYRMGREILAEQQLYQKLYDIVKELDLPQVIAFDVFRIMRKKNRGLYSESAPYKELIKLLQKDDYYLYRNKLIMLKGKYEEISRR